MYAPPARQERLSAAAASFVAVAAVGWALLSGLDVSQIVQAVAPLVSVDLTTPPPLKPPTPTRERPKIVHRSAAKQKASPRNLRNKATAIVAPPIKPIVPPPPVIAAPKPGPGLAANNGASSRAGPGEGAGGIGNGRGGGGDGGDGDGEIPPEQIGGHLSFSDLPRDLAEQGRGGTVGVRYFVDVDGRVSGCSVTDSSGIAALDTVTCRLIEQRFRFRPSRTATGQPVRSMIVESHSWSVDREDMDRDRG